jgi:hypothetical protein
MSPSDAHQTHEADTGFTSCAITESRSFGDKGFVSPSFALTTQGSWRSSLPLWQKVGAPRVNLLGPCGLAPFHDPGFEDHVHRRRPTSAFLPARTLPGLAPIRWRRRFVVR